MQNQKLHFFCFLIAALLTVDSLIFNANAQLINDKDSNFSSGILMPSSTNATQWIQNGFTNSFLISNKNSNLFLQISFSNITSNDSFPLVALCLNFVCYFSEFGTNETFNLVYYKHNFEAYYFQKTDHFLTLLKDEYQEEDLVYLTIFNIFEYDNTSQLEYLIIYTANDSETNCSVIWGDNDDCDAKSFYFNPNDIYFNDEHSTFVGQGKPQRFFSKYTSEKTKSIFTIKSSNSVFFLKKLNKEVVYNDSSIFSLNDLDIFYFQNNFSANLTSLDSPNAVDNSYIDFVLIPPWSENTSETNVSISIITYNNSGDLTNPGFMEIKEIIYTIVTLGLAVILILLTFIIINQVIKYKTQNRRLEMENLTKISSEILNKYFALKDYTQFKMETQEHECCICLQNFMDGEKCRELFCFHVFHQECLDLWILEHQTCPVCRKEYIASKLEKEKIDYLERIKTRSESTNRNYMQNLITINHQE